MFRYSLLLWYTCVTRRCIYCIPYSVRYPILTKMVEATARVARYVELMEQYTSDFNNHNMSVSESTLERMVLT